MAFSPDSGLKIAGTVVLVTETPVEVDGVPAAAVVSGAESLFAHETVSNRTTTGARRFNMMW